jgi:hypothetical protein
VIAVRVTRWGGADDVEYDSDQVWVHVGAEGEGSGSQYLHGSTQDRAKKATLDAIDARNARNSP